MARKRKLRTTTTAAARPQQHPQQTTIPSPLPPEPRTRRSSTSGRKRDRNGSSGDGWKSISTLQVAFAVSLAAHAALLTVRVVAPDAFNRVFADATLDVVLVNARTPEKPVRAQAIAQANLSGGGEAVAGLATSPLPPSPHAHSGDANEDARKRIEQLQQTQQQLLAQIRRELALLPAPDPQRDPATPEAQAQEEKRRELIELLAEIEKRINEENARPKKRYISPATREEVYAIYYDALRRKIELRGTRNFPESQGRKLYGELTMNVTVDAEGRVIETEVVRPSNSGVLDRRAVAIVRAAAPFGPFSAAMRRTAHQLVITSRFRFTREDGLETTLSATPGK